MVAVRVTTHALFSAWHQLLIKKRKMRRYVRCLECYCAICGQVLPITNSAYRSLRWIKAITSGQVAMMGSQYTVLCSSGSLLLLGHAIHCHDSTRSCICLADMMVRSASMTWVGAFKRHRA